MGPERQNPIQRTVSLFICVRIALCTIVAHNIAQNRPDSFPPYPPDNHHCSDDVYLREGGVMSQRKAPQRSITRRNVLIFCSLLWSWGDGSPCAIRPLSCLYVCRQCFRWGPSSPQKGGHSSPPNCRPMSIVAKRLDGARCHLVRM